MTQVPPVNIKVNVDATGVATGVSVVEQNLNALSAKAKSTTSAFGGFKTMALGMFAGNIMTQGMMALTNAFREAKDGVIADQVAMSRLDQVLENIGVTSEKTKASVLATADSYYKLGFAGDDSITAMGSLVAATGDVEQATKLMAMSADFARYKDISQTQAAQILAKATMGNAKALKDLGITLDATLPKNQAITKAFAELNDKIGGQAVAYTKTFAGQMEILKEKFDNFLQIIATKILPILNKFLTFVLQNGTAILYLAGVITVAVIVMKTYAATTAAMKTIQQAYAFWTYAQAASTSVFRFAMAQLNATMRANPIGAVITAIIVLGTAFIWAWNKFEGFRKGVVKGLQIIINAVGYLIGYYATLLNALGKIPGMGWAKSAGEALDKVANKVRNYSDSLDSLAKKKIGGNQAPGFITPDVSNIQGNLEGGDAAGKDGKGTGQTVQYVTVYASNTNDIAKKLSKAAKHGQPIGGGR